MSFKQHFSAFINPVASTLMVLSTIAWTLVFVIPFLDYSATAMAGMITGLIVLGEVSFYIAILLLGKPMWQKIKAYCKETLSEKFKP